MRDVEVRLSGEGAGLPAMTGIAVRSSLQPGTRLDHQSYERLKAELLRTALELGFLDARLTRHELEVDPANVRADARIELDTGGRYEFGEVRIEQEAIDPKLLQGFVRFAQGQPYSAERIRSTQYALEDSNYFAKVSVSPGERDPQALTVPVTIRGESIKRNRYGVSVGYGTDTGFRGQFSWDNRLVNTHGHRWRVETTLSQVLQEAVARYVIPIGDPTLEKLEFSTGYVNEDIGDLESSRIELMAGLTQVFGLWQRVLFVKLNQEKTGFPDGTESDALLFIPGISYASLPPNFLTGWVRDAAYYLELTGSPQSLGSDASYLRFYTRAEKVWSITGPWHLRLRGEFGTSWVSDFSELPASQRFFAGGDRSVRGFALDELSPVDPEPRMETATRKGVGGEHKIVGSVELERDLPRDFRGAIFFDTGNAFTDWDTPLEYSVGVGVRWKLPMLLIGLDVAQALSEPGKTPRFHLNITQVL
jgi:translocation and assembly module TamA